MMSKSAAAAASASAAAARESDGDQAVEQEKVVPRCEVKAVVGPAAVVL